MQLGWKVDFLRSVEASSSYDVDGDWLDVSNFNFFESLVRISQLLNLFVWDLNILVKKSHDIKQSYDPTDVKMWSKRAIFWASLIK